MRSTSRRTGQVPWFEKRRHDLTRLSATALAVLCLHVAMIAGLLYWLRPLREPDLSLELAAPQIEEVAAPAVESPTPPQPQQTAPEPEQKPIQPQQIAPLATAPPSLQRTPPPQVARATPPTAAAAGTATPKIGRELQIDPAWQSLLYKRLQQAEAYPPGARRRREEGVVMLTVRVNRAGQVLSRQVVKGSGHADLDAEALAMIAGVQPLPALPPTMPVKVLVLTVPVRFSLR